MAKLKPAKGGGKKGAAKSFASAVPCLILLISLFALIMFLFYWSLKSNS